MKLIYRSREQQDFNSLLEVEEDVCNVVNGHSWTQLLIMLSSSLDKNLVELIRRSITIIFKSLIATLEATSQLRGIYLSSLHLSGKL